MGERRQSTGGSYRDSGPPGLPVPFTMCPIMTDSFIPLRGTTLLLTSSLHPDRSDRCAVQVVTPASGH